MKLAAVLLMGLTGVLRAQDFIGAGVSAQTAARGGVYLPGPDNAGDALARNPAGLAYLAGPVVNVSVLGAVARGSFSNSANRNQPMSGNAGLVPFGAAALPLGKRWTLAAGAAPEMLSVSKWRLNDAPGVGGADYGMQNEKSEIVAYRGTAGVSFRVSPRLAIGATVSAVYNANTLVMPYVFQSHPDLKGLKTLLDLHTTGVGVSESFGVLVNPARRWEIGAAFHTRSSIASSGSATGNMGAQFAALGIPFRPDFAYRAKVNVELPQSASLSLAWKMGSVTRLSAETSWTNWNRSFASLPVSLMGGTNSDINGFLGSSSIKDLIPLQWKDQYAARIGLDRQVGENVSLTGGYRYQNNPVPSSTLSPMTAAIMGHGLSAGAGYRMGRARFDLAYVLNLSATQSVGRSALLSGEFSNSRVRVGTQGLILSTSFYL